MITIIPAIDILGGQCIRLTRGDFQLKTVYHDDPLQVAKQFEAIGIKRLHVVDLDGARQKKIVNWNILETIATKTSLQIDFGGGIQSDDDIAMAFHCGAQQVNIGSVAVKNKPRVLAWLEHYGSEKIILSADAKAGKIAIYGWQEQTEIDVLEFISDYHDEGIQSVVCTDISRDGTLQGPAFDLYRAIKTACPTLYCIASGGISRIADVTALDQLKIDGVIIGKAIYEGNIQLEELQAYVC